MVQRQQITVARLQEKGVNIKICEECGKRMRIQLNKWGGIPSNILFVNAPKNIYFIMHRRCKMKFVEKKRL